MKSCEMKHEMTGSMEMFYSSFTPSFCGLVWSSSVKLFTVGPDGLVWPFEVTLFSDAFTLSSNGIIFSLLVCEHIYYLKNTFGSDVSSLRSRKTDPNNLNRLTKVAKWQLQLSEMADF